MLLSTISKTRLNSRYLNYQIENKMATVDSIRNRLIDKIQSIKNKDFLEVLDKIVSSNFDIVELTEEQKAMLEMSEEDIKNGRFISQEEMDKRNLEWLNEM